MFRVYFVSETAQVELRSGRVSAPGHRSPQTSKGKGAIPRWEKRVKRVSMSDMTEGGTAKLKGIMTSGTLMLGGGSRRATASSDVSFLTEPALDASLQTSPRLRGARRNTYDDEGPDSSEDAKPSTRPPLLSRTKTLGSAGTAAGQGLTLTHFSAQPEPFWSISRFVFSLWRVMTRVSNERIPQSVLTLSREVDEGKPLLLGYPARHLWGQPRSSWARVKRTKGVRRS
jgi:hypothetical protein